MAIESPSPLSSEEVTRVRDNVDYIRKRYPADPDGEKFSAVLSAVEAAAEGEAPVLSESLHLLLVVLRARTRKYMERLFNAAESDVNLDATVGGFHLEWRGSCTDGSISRLAGGGIDCDGGRL